MSGGPAEPPGDRGGSGRRIEGRALPVTQETVKGADLPLPPLPPNTRPLSHQVAGHVYGKSSSRLGMLECGDGTILKPLPEGCCGERELAFYTSVWGATGYGGQPHGVTGGCGQPMDVKSDSRQPMGVRSDSRQLIGLTGDSRQPMNETGDSRQLMGVTGDCRQPRDWNDKNGQLMEAMGDSGQSRDMITHNRQPSDVFGKIRQHGDAAGSGQTGDAIGKSRQPRGATSNERQPTGMTDKSGQPSDNTGDSRNLTGHTDNIIPPTGQQGQPIGNGEKMSHSQSYESQKRINRICENEEKGNGNRTRSNPQHFEQLEGNNTRFEQGCGNNISDKDFSLHCDECTLSDAFPHNTNQSQQQQHVHIGSDMTELQNRCSNKGGGLSGNNLCDKYKERTRQVEQGPHYLRDNAGPWGGLSGDKEGTQGKTFTVPNGFVLGDNWGRSRHQEGRTNIELLAETDDNKGEARRGERHGKGRMDIGDGSVRDGKKTGEEEKDGAGKLAGDEGKQTERGHGKGDVWKSVEIVPNDEEEGEKGNEEMGAPDDVLVLAQALTPVYLGTYTDPATPDVEYLRLADLTAGFRRPCIADVKIGRRSYDPEATPDKITKELHKYPPQQTLCFQLKGMRSYCRRSDRFTTRSKEFLRSLDEASVMSQGFERFFNNGHGIREDIVKTCVEKLNPVISWAERQRLFAFYASSILIIYEGCPGDHCACTQQPILPPVRDLQGTSSVHKGRDLARVSADTGCAPCEALSEVHLGESDMCLGTQGERLTLGGATLSRHQTNPNCPLRPAQDESEAGPRGTGFVGNSDAAKGKVTLTCGCSRVEVKMIDFARVFPTKELDMNYLQGLNSLKGHLLRLLPGSCDQVM